MIRIREIPLPPEHDVNQLIFEASRLLRVSASKVRNIKIVRRSVDARKKSDVKIIYTIDVTVDGNDVMAVYEAVKEAVDRARAGEGPTLVECKTYRWDAHNVGGLDKRPKEEVEAWKAKEPIAPYTAKLADDPRAVITLPPEGANLELLVGRAADRQSDGRMEFDLPFADYEMLLIQLDESGLGYLAEEYPSSAGDTILVIIELEQVPQN